jgi:hypothetical protein
MIELWLTRQPFKAKGLIPGQVVRVHLPSGVFNITRMGSECIARCRDDEKGKEDE